jgi:Pilus formation protein N terminal region
MVMQLAPNFLRLFALGLALSLPGAGQAQTVPPCQTTAGEEGLFFTESHAMVFSPVAFDDVRSTAKGVVVFPDIRQGQGVQIFLGKASSDGVVEFLADGSVVHQCLARIVAFDPAVHDLAQLQSGDCALKLVAGRTELLAGHGQVLELPQDIVDFSIAAPRFVGLSTLTSRRIYLQGYAPGVTVLVWLTDGVSGEFAINLCPIRVVGTEAVLAAGGPLDGDLCQDAEGAPMRLAVGQTARMAFRDDAGNAVEYREAAVASPKVVELNFDDEESAGVTGLAPGWTTLTFSRADMVTSCEIVVE